MPIAIAPLNTPLRVIRISSDPKVKKTFREFRNHYKFYYYNFIFRWGKCNNSC